MKPFCAKPSLPYANPWTGKGNPLHPEGGHRAPPSNPEERQGHHRCRSGDRHFPRKFIEQGGDLIIIYNSGRFRMAGHGSTSGLMSYGDANAVAMEIGEFEVLPVVEETPARGYATD